jgi:hypothetical protein
MSWWHLDEMARGDCGLAIPLWRAVGDEGDVSICWGNAGAPRQS